VAKRLKDGNMTRIGNPLLPEHTPRSAGMPVPREKKSQKAQYKVHDPGPRNDRVTKFNRKIGQP